MYSNFIVIFNLKCLDLGTYVDTYHGRTILLQKWSVPAPFDKPQTFVALSPKVVRKRSITEKNLSIMEYKCEIIQIFDDNETRSFSQPWRIFFWWASFLLLVCCWCTYVAHMGWVAAQKIQRSEVHKKSRSSSLTCYLRDAYLFVVVFVAFRTVCSKVCSKVCS
jgi:hypothetical protein